MPNHGYGWLFRFCLHIVSQQHFSGRNGMSSNRFSGPNNCQLGYGPQPPLYTLDAMGGLSASRPFGALTGIAQTSADCPGYCLAWLAGRQLLGQKKVPGGFAAGLLLMPPPFGWDSLTRLAPPVILTEAVGLW